ncbi:MAG: glycosyltransferase, partial [Segatella oulorum]
MIRFSIITCTYQAASVLQRTLDSVLHQSYSHLEHIILDGASTDDTVSMVKHYMEENEAQEDCIHDIIFTSER